MSNVALNKEGQFVLADQMSESAWNGLKASYGPGDFTMPCCSSPATLKTSSNGLPFFAHYSDECASAPETKWHREAKALIAANLTLLGHTCREEEISEAGTETWRADTYCEMDGRRIVIELQRSYQHLNDYLRRQRRYVKAGIESYWLLIPERFLKLSEILGKYRLKHEFGGIIPEGSFRPFIPELPVLSLETGDAPAIRGVQFEIAIGDWLIAVIEKRFVWDDGAWIIVNSDMASSRAWT